jgi:Rrf2 family protein
MMRISRTVVYAIHATLELTRSQMGCPVPCSELASRGKMPARFLLHILRTLVKHGVLRSTAGVAGGYYLGRSADRITLLEIVEAFGNHFNPALPQSPCFSPPEHRQLMTTLVRTADAARNELRKLTLADLKRSSDENSSVEFDQMQSPKSALLSTVVDVEKVGESIPLLGSLV